MKVAATAPLPRLAEHRPQRAASLGLPEDTLFLSKLPPIEGDFPPPPPALKRPVLIVHGFNGAALDFFNMRNYLASNPKNKLGSTFHAGKEDEFRASLRKQPDGRIHTITFSKPYLSYRELQAELTACLKVLNEETGGEVDVITHSMGGLATRAHLDQGNDGIDKLIMIAPPNRGSLEADLALAADRLKLYSHYIPEAKDALRDLTLDEEFLGQQNNPYLSGLNQRWAEQSAKVQVTIIAGLGIPTPDWNWKLFSQGDGMVTANSTYMPGARFAVTDVEQPAGIEREGDSGNRLFTFKYNHGSLVSDPTIQQFVGQVLGEQV